MDEQAQISKAAHVDATTAVAIASAATSAAGLGFVGWSVRVLVLQMRTQSHQAIYAHQQEVDALLFQRLDLKRIVEGRAPLPDPSDALYEDVMAAVELFLTMFEHAWAHGENMSPEVAAQWRAYIRTIAAEAAFAHYLSSKPRDWFAPGFREYLGYGELEDHSEDAPRSAVRRGVDGPPRGATPVQPADIPNAAPPRNAPTP